MMSAINLPPVNPAPTPTQLVAPPAPAAHTASATGSFSQWLQAADARSQAQAPVAAPAASAPAKPENKAQNSQAAARPQSTAQKTATRDGSRSERAAGEAESETNSAERGDAATAADEADAHGCSAPTDPASLLASLGLGQRAKLAAAVAEAGSARGRGGSGRPSPDVSADVGLARSGAATAATQGVSTADLKAGDGAAAGGSAGRAFAGLLAAAQGGAASSEAGAAMAVAEQRTPPQADARPSDASTLASLLGTAAAPAAATAGSTAAHPAEARLSTPPGQAGFAEQLGAQLSTFVRDGVQHARLQLHPLELGPVTVQIQLDGGSAHLSFAAEHASTRQALEQALPTLAGSLREAGLTLSGGGVFEQPRQPQPEGDGGRGDGKGTRGGNGGGNDGADDGARLQAATGPAQRRRGVVDLVA